MTTNDAAESSRDQSTRRHDLDALRALAMLLGIALHASMSFNGWSWIVTDTRTHRLFIPFMNGIHAFRMQLFMLLSGFFLMMSYRKRGLFPVLGQRFQRIVLPLLLGIVTIIPAFEFAATDAGLRMAIQKADTSESDSALPAVIEAIRSADTADLQTAIAADCGGAMPDSEFGIAPLGWAALFGDSQAVSALIDAGADIKAKSNDGYTAAHFAALMGHYDVLKLLLEHGADPFAKTLRGVRPRGAARTKIALTSAIASSLGVQPRPVEELISGRRECIRILTTAMADAQPASPLLAEPTDFLSGVRRSYADWMASDRFLTGWNREGEPVHLFRTPLIHHLWFLWFLFWLVAFFGLTVTIAKRLPQRWLDKIAFRPSSLCFALMALSLLPQAFMGGATHTIGPDTSSGVLPMPHVLAYYAVFFAYGIAWYAYGSELPPGGRYWKTSLFLAAFVALPASMFTFSRPILNMILQAALTWLAIFGLIGGCHQLLHRPNKAIRYLAESSYFLYLAHLPLVIYLQGLIRTWDQPVFLKFLVLCSAVTGILLAVYQVAVRNTSLGSLLNGPSVRSEVRAKKSFDQLTTAEISALRNSAA